MRILVDGKPHDGPNPNTARIPKSVAFCPDCMGQLLLSTSCFDTETGKPIEGELFIRCEKEAGSWPLQYNAMTHSYSIRDWPWVNDAILKWVSAHVRAEKETN